jgi:hypothetical protein
MNAARPAASIARPAALIARLAGMIALLASLGTCQLAGLFSLTAFPEALSRVSAQANLSAVIPGSVAHEFLLSAVVMNDGTELVTLVNNGGYAGVHVCVMDSSLNVTGTLTDTDIGGALTARTATADAGVPQKVSIGDRVFAVSGGVLGASTVKPSAGPFTGSWAATAPVNLNGAFGISGTTFDNLVYDGAWSNISSQMGNPISTTGDSYSLAGLFSDSSRASTVLILKKPSTQQADVLEVPWLDMTDGFWPPGPIIPLYRVFSMECKWTGLLGYAGGVVVSYRQSTTSSMRGEFYCTDLTGTELAGTLRPDRSFSTEDQLAVSPTGKYFFVYDPESRTVSRWNAWW